MKRLGVTEEQMAGAPPLTVMLKQAEGGLDFVLESLRFSEDETVRQFVEKYDSVPSGDRETLSWEAIAIADGISLPMLLGGIMLALQAYSSNQVRLMAITSHPKVMQARIASALLPGGHKDRDSYQTGIGFLPTPSGPTFINNVQAPKLPSNIGPQQPVLEAGPADFDHLFPKIGEQENALAPIRRKMLEDGV